MVVDEAFYASMVRSALAPKSEARRVLAISKCMDMEKVLAKVCPFCGAGFRYRSAFVMHVLARHPAEFNSVVDCVSKVLRRWSRMPEVK